MPNQRKRGKKELTLWVTKEQAEKIDELVRLTGMKRSDVIKAAIIAAAKKEGINIEDDNH